MCQSLAGGSKKNDNQLNNYNIKSANFQSQQYYACKSVKAEFVSNGDRMGYHEYINAVAQLVFEAHVLSSFDHPNIIKMRGLSANGLDIFAKKNHHDEMIGVFGNRNYGIGHGGFYLLTDLLQETLDQRIDRWIQFHCDKDDGNDFLAVLYLKNIDKYNVCLQLASALEYVHSRNVIYRDLKPTNIGFTYDGKLNLFDFGLACELTPSKQKATGIIGTMRYMAPEVCLGQEYDCDCDIYSYAIVCYELWTQCLPYETLTPELYQEYVCRRGYRPNQDQENNQHMIPYEVSMLLSQAWKHNPSSRTCWSEIQNQLTLFKQLEQFRLEECGLFLEPHENHNGNEHT